jgi:GAF domain-containing protein
MQLREQRLLNMVLLGLAIPGALFGLTMLVLWILGRVPPAGAIAGLAVQPFYALSYWLGQRGKVRLAAYIPVIAVFAVMVLANLQLGLGHVTYIGYAIITLTASILIGSGAGVFFALLSTAAHIFVGYLQASGTLIPSITPVDSYLADGIGLGLGLIVLIAFTSIYHREINSALHRERLLHAQLQDKSASMEVEIKLRTQALEKRLVQLRTAAEISRSIAAVLDPPAMLAQVVDLIRDRFNLYYVGVFLLDEDCSYAVLRAGTGDAGEKMLAEPYKLAVGGVSTIGWVAANRKASLNQDIDQGPNPFSMPHLLNTRSEIVLPIITGDTLLGVLSFQSSESNYFDEDDITLLQGIADSLATALDNARLFQEAQANLEEIQALHRHYLTGAWEESIARHGEIAYTAERENTQENSQVQAEETLVHSIPLKLREGKIGQLVIEREGLPLSQDEQAVLEAITLQSVLSLENARLLKEAQRLVRREKMINQISGEIRGSMDLDQILQDTVRELGKAMGSSRAFIQIGLEPTAGEAQTDPPVAVEEPNNYGNG